MNDAFKSTMTKVIQKVDGALLWGILQSVHGLFYIRQILFFPLQVAVTGSRSFKSGRFSFLFFFQVFWFFSSGQTSILWHGQLRAN